MSLISVLEFSTLEGPLCAELVESPAVSTLGEVWQGTPVDRQSFPWERQAESSKDKVEETEVENTSPHWLA